MKRLMFAVIVLFTASYSACSSPSPIPTVPTASIVATASSTPALATPTVTSIAQIPSAVPATPTQQPATKSGILRTIDPNPIGLRNVPYMMALDALRQQGYTIKTTAYATTDLYATALVKGEIDIAYFSDQLAWAASAKSAPVRTILSFNGDPYLIAAKLDIKACADLESKIMAYGSNSTVNSVMLDQYLKQTCPGTKPQIVLIPNSPARLAALLSGQIDSVLLETDDALQLDRQAPGRFHILHRFVDEFPTIEVGGYHVRSDFAGQHPEIVKDFLTALIQAHRRVQDKQLLIDAIGKYLNNDATALAAVDTYLAQNAWDVNGGLTPQRVQDTLDFLIAANMLPSDLKADQVADLSFLDAVLKEVGRK
jgi:NitT/TauT family transport system substrate-binding protein